MKNNILVIDTMPNSRFAAAVALQKAGYKISEAEDEAAALSTILDAQEKGEPFDLLLIDVKMPGIHGVELIYKLERQCLSIPILVTTNHVDRILITELVRNCCFDLLVKPFDSQELVKRVGDILCRHEKGFPSS